MKVTLLHPTGNSNVRAILAALDKENILHEFDTTLAFDPKSGLLNRLPNSVREELLRRVFPVPKEKIWTHPILEITRMILLKMGFNNAVKHEHSWAGVDSVYKNLDMAAARRLLKISKKNTIEAVYAYEDGALNTFIQAKKLGIKCIYDLPIAYWETGRKLMLEEAERLPNWAHTLGGGIKNSTQKLERKTRELELADMVIGPGKFVMDSLPDWAKTKQIVTAPFGSPQLNSSDDTEKKGTDKRPLRVLFAGSMGQRKGLADLFAAMKLLNSYNVELIVMGSLLAPMKFYRDELPNFTYEAGRPHKRVLELMRSCDIFCLPSIVEGRALVMQEAMSQGLPIIITANTGGEDLIHDGNTGFLVPIRSPESIAEKIDWFLNNRSAVSEMGEMAKLHAENYTWENYGKKIVESISRFLE